MTNHHRTLGCCTRRHFLACQAMGIGGLALSWLLNQEGLRAETAKPNLEKPTFDLTPRPPHFQPQAKAMISLWMQGGPSHIDLCDPKPELDRLDGKPLPGGLDLKDDTNKTRVGAVLASPWKFKKHGQCGMELSELLPHLGDVVDDITLVRSMYAPTVNNHGQAIRAFQHADGSNRLNSDRPSLGSWFAYGLGSETQSLPAFVALIDSGDLPIFGVGNWNNGFLPSVYQGTVIRPEEPRIVNLDAPAYLKGEPQESALDFLERMNRRHLADNPGNDDLEARIASFQLAARMQLAAAEAMDVSRETKETQRLYGLDDPLTREFGANCLLGRRLIERGVRFVQVCTGSQYWDHHGRIISDLPTACRRTDQPVAALIKDLKRRGLLDSTIVHWGGEMGRLPVIQGAGTNRASIGRDHNVYGFSMWLAGGGFKGGHVHGATDEFGFKAVADPVSHADYHATLLHLFGLDPEQLVYRLGTQDLRLSDGRHPARIVRELLKNPPKV